MPAVARDPSFVAWDDYLEGESSGETRHEYLNGKVYAMAGASDNHVRIAGNIFAALHAHLRGSPCEPFGSDMKVRIRYLHETIAYYPDAMVVCDPSDDHPYFRDRPTVLFEVASETTERLDKREKLFAYVTIPTLEEYVIVEQSRMAALVFRREGNWVSETVSGPEGVIVLQSLQCELPFSDLYARVDFRPAESASR